MIGEIFSYILTTSLYASIVGLIILIIKALLKDRISAFWQCLIWAVLIIKLVVPFGPASSISVFNQIPVEKVQSSINDFKYPRQDHLITPVTDNTLPEKSGNLAPAAPGQMDRTQEIIPYIWLSVASLYLILVLLSNLSLHLRLRRRSRKPNEHITSLLRECRSQLGVRRDISIVIQDTVKAPSLLGILRPRILMSSSVENLSDQEMQYILMHELAHYKRKDVLVYCLLMVLQVMHWFNPILWYCFKRMRQDMELAADEMVLNKLDAAEYREYGRALLTVLDNMGRDTTLPRLVGMVNDRDDIERRIKMVSQAHLLQNKRRLLFIVGLVCVLVLGTILLTSSRESAVKINASPQAAKHSNVKMDTPGISKLADPSKVLTDKAQYEQLLKRTEMDSEIIKGLILSWQTNSKEELGTGQLRWPLAGSPRVSADYGMRYHPILKRKSLHTGVDITTAKGTPVLAADGGKVIYVGTVGSYGKLLVIDHGKGLSTVYTQLFAVEVINGETVTKGSQIGQVGSTGFSTGPHLHFEVRKNGVPVDPNDYV